MASNEIEKIYEYGIASGIIDLSELKELYEMNERKKYLAKHNHVKWVAKNGKWCTYLPDDKAPKHRKIIRRNTEKELDDVIVDYWKQFENNPTVEEIFEEWNDRKLAQKTIKSATHMIHKQIFKRFYKEMGKRKIKAITECEWEDFLTDCIWKYDLTSKAFSNLKSLTKGFLERAKKRGIISFAVKQFFMELDTSDYSFKKSVVEDEKEVFYNDEIEMVMNYIHENPDPRNIGVALMFVTGIRVGELVALKHEDFDDTIISIKREESRHKDENTGRIIYYVDDFPKTPAGYRKVFVPTDQKLILDKIKLLNPFGEYIFVRNDGTRMRTFDIRDRLYRICRWVGIPARSPHKIRKTYGSILLDNNLDQKLIISQMGHTNIACTENHYHRDRRRINDKQNIIDSIPEFMAK